MGISPKGSGHPWRPLILFVLKLAGAGLSFALLFHFIEARRVLASLAQANLPVVAAGVLVFLAGQVAAASRWRGILGCQAIALPLAGALRINLVGTFVGNFLPGMGTGDLTKSALLFRDYPEKRSFLMASVVYDRLLGLAAILLLAILGTLYLGLVCDDWGFVISVTVGALVFAGAMAGGASEIILAWGLRLLPEMLAARCALFARELQKLLRTRALFWRSFGLSLGFQLSWVVSQWLMLLALSAAAPFMPVLAASPLSLIVALLPVSLNGLGLREGAFSFMLQRFGIEPGVAVAAALLSLAPILISSVIGGLLLLCTGNLLGKTGAPEAGSEGGR